MIKPTQRTDEPDEISQEEADEMDNELNPTFADYATQLELIEIHDTFYEAAESWLAHNGFHIRVLESPQDRVELEQIEPRTVFVIRLDDYFVEQFFFETADQAILFKLSVLTGAGQ